MKPVLAIAFSLAGASVAASALAAPQVATPAQGASSFRRYPGVSDSGNAIIAGALNAPDPQRNALVGQLRSLHDQMTSAASASSVDVERVGGLLRQLDALQAQYHQQFTQRLVAAMRQLPQADRGPFLRDLLMPPPGAPQR